MAFSGTYRGVARFRSLLELSLIRHLEEEGLVLGSTMLYEETRIPYGTGRKRTYVVDLTLTQTRTLVEVKPTVRVKNGRNVAKRRGAEAWAEANGWTYVIVTEREIGECAHLLTLVEAATIPEVVLDPRALKRLGRSKRRARRRQVKG
jgi:hypothetical protein